MGNTPLQNIPKDITRDFGTWMLSQEKGGYENKVWSREYVNGVISEVLRMYKKVGVRDKYLSSLDQVPEIDYLKSQPTNQIKRDILSVDEYERLVLYLRTNDFLKPKGSSLIEQGRRSISESSLVFHNTGMRPNEILQLKWSDVSINITTQRKIRKCSGYSRSEVKTQRLDG